MSHRVITANRLEDGAVVWFAGAAAWRASLDDAVASDDDDTVAGWLAAAKQLEAAGTLISVYEVEVEPASAPGARRLTPVRLRERIRADGPTVAVG